MLADHLPTIALLLFSILLHALVPHVRINSAYCELLPQDISGVSHGQSLGRHSSLSGMDGAHQSLGSLWRGGQHDSPKSNTTFRSLRSAPEVGGGAAFTRTFSSRSRCSRSRIRPCCSLMRSCRDFLCARRSRTRGACFASPTVCCGSPSAASWTLVLSGDEARGPCSPHRRA